MRRVLPLAVDPVAYGLFLSAPQLTMRGPPGPAGMTGRSGPVVSVRHANTYTHDDPIISQSVCSALGDELCFL